MTNIKSSKPAFLAKKITRFSHYIVLTLIMILSTGITFYFYVNAEKQIDKANQLRLQSLLLVDELRQSSDDLTRMVRSYVIIGDSIYKDYFYEILAIQDGNKPRPVNYHHNYWALVQKNAPRPSPDGSAIPLLTLMQQAGFTAVEFALLEQAKIYSDVLNKTEFAAMALIEGKSPINDSVHLKAVNMLSDDNFHNAKANIMRPITQLLESVEQRTQKAVVDAEKNALSLRYLFIVLSLLLLATLHLVYLALHKILGCSVTKLQQHFEQSGSGDFAKTIVIKPHQKNSILAWLSETQHNLMRLENSYQQAEWNLKESEERLNLCQKYGGIGSFDVDLINDRQTWSNSFYEVLGFPDASNPRMEGFLAVVYPEDRQAIIDAYHAHFYQGQKYEVEYRAILTDGKLHWLRAVGQAQFAADGTPIRFMGIVQDITERKQAELEMQALIQRNNILMDNAVDGIHILDMQGRLVEANRAFCNLLGYSSEEILQLKIADWDAKLTPSEVQAALKQLENGQNVFVTIHRRKDGNLIDVEISAAPVELDGQKYIFAASRNISERKKLQSQIEYVSELNQKIIAQSSFGFKVFCASGQCIACNQAAADTLGKSIDELLKENFYNLKLWQATGLVNTALSCLREKMPQQQEIQYVHPDGKTVWLDYHFATFNHHEPHLLVIVHDVTEFRLNEIALENARQVAIAANQAKSEFLANMSHEIRTPMNAILGFSEILTDLITDNTQRYYLDAIYRSGKTLLQLINDILDLSKIEAGKFTLQYAPVSVSDLLADISIVFSQKAKDKSIDFSVLIDDKLPAKLMLDEIRLRQVILNLVGNAIKFTDHGFVKILVTVSFKAPTGKVNLSIEVCDSGTGIPKAQQEKIFAAFTQQDNQDTAFGGTGLGLTISKRLSKLMQGNLYVESGLGKGSCFTVTLNNVEIVADTPKLIPNESIPVAETLHFQAARILLVDDIDMNRQLIISYLAEFRELTILEAETGQQALECVQQQPFDLIFMDRRLPDIDGDTVCQKIKALPDCVDIPIVMITASVLTNEEKQQPIFYDMQLNKPVNKAELLNTMLSFLPLAECTEITPQSPIEAIAESREEPVNPELLALLISNYQGRIAQIKNSGAFEIDLLLEIAGQLQALADHYECRVLTDWASALKTHAQLFDIMNVTETLHNFEALLEKLDYSS